MANPEHLALLQQGITAWNEWRKVNPDIKPDLRGADLRGADLREADLRGADLFGAILRGAILRGADLREADLSAADLSAANLFRARLNKARLSRTILNWADLREADLRGADLLFGVNLFGAILRGAILNEADLNEADLVRWAILGAEKSASPAPVKPVPSAPVKLVPSALVKPVPPTPLESVLLGASAPTNVRSGEEFTVRFVAYLQELEEQVDKILRGLSPRSKSHLGVGWCRWKEGVQVTVILSCQHLDIAEPQQEFEWHGPYQIISFDVVTQKTAPAATVVLKLDVYIHGVRVASLRLDLQICNVNQRTYQKVTALPAAKAFASYASQDRLRVLDCVAALQVGAGMDIFQDCLSLHPNEPWKEKLLQEILDRNIFLLFGSKYAMVSQWVKWEWTIALEKRGEEVIQLYPLDTVEEAPPPPELAHLHFGSPIMRIRKSYEVTTTKANP